MICISILLPSFIPCEAGVKVGVCAAVQVSQPVNNWLVQFQTSHCLWSNHHLPSRSKSVFCVWTLSVGGRAHSDSGRSSAESQKPTHLSLNGIAVCHHIPVARLQCRDGVGWVAEVPSRGEGRAEESTTPAIILWSALQTSHTTACKLGWKEAKWPLTSWILKFSLKPGRYLPRG